MDNKFQKEATFLETASATTLAAVVAAALYKFLFSGNSTAPAETVRQITAATLPSLNMNELSGDERSTAFSVLKKELSKYDKIPENMATKSYDELKRTGDSWLSASLTPEERAGFQPEYLSGMTSRAMNAGRPQDAAQYALEGTKFYSNNPDIIGKDPVHKENANRFFNTMFQLSEKKGDPANIAQKDMSSVRQQLSSIQDRLDPTSASAKRAALETISSGNLGTAGSLPAFGKLTANDIKEYLSSDKYQSASDAVKNMDPALQQSNQAYLNVRNAFQKSDDERAVQQKADEEIKNSLGYKVTKPISDVAAWFTGGEGISRAGQIGKSKLDDARTSAIQTLEGLTPAETLRGAGKAMHDSYEEKANSSDAALMEAARKARASEERFLDQRRQFKDRMDETGKALSSVGDVPPPLNGAQAERQAVNESASNYFRR